MCKYYEVNGVIPCCTHDCEGCIWHVADNKDKRME